MKRIYFSYFFVLISVFIYSQEYKLIWEEQFDGDKLNENIWTKEYNKRGGGNYEAQFYTPQNVRLVTHSSGATCLVLSAKRENYRGRPVTSGRVNTAQKLAVQYGKIEIRVKLPNTANGLWPAFWMLGDDLHEVGWPRCGEIDIIEVGHFNGINSNNQDRYFNGALHWGEKWDHGRHPNLAMHSLADYSLKERFHLFTLIWTPDSILMYLDRDKFPNVKPYFHMKISGDDGLNQPARYFHKPFHLIANLAVGGGFTGLPYHPCRINLFPSWNRNFRKITALPPRGQSANLYIDYIRIYQNGTPGEQFIIKK